MGGFHCEGCNLLNGFSTLVGKSKVVNTIEDINFVLNNPVVSFLLFIADFIEKLLLTLFTCVGKN